MKYPPTKFAANAVKAACRARMVCEWCGRKLLRPEAAHAMTAGAGTPTIPEVLVCLGGPWECGHHAANHNGKPPTDADLLAIAAKRHGTTPDAIRQAVHDIRALPKEGRPDAILERLRGKP